MPKARARQTRADGALLEAVAGDNRPFAIRRFAPDGPAGGAEEDVPDPPLRGGRRGQLHARPDPRHDASLDRPGGDGGRHLHAAHRRRPDHLDPSRPRPLHRQGRRGQAACSPSSSARRTATASGRGGSMHIADVAKGNLGANGIVGGGLPIAVGAALAAKKLEARRRSSSRFFGDGANNEGAFHEALNMASIWKLPVIFVCENNQYGMSTSTARSTAVANVADRAARLCDAGRHRRRQRLLRRRRGVVSPRSRAPGRARARRLIESKTYRYARPFASRDRNRYRTQGRDRGLDRRATRSRASSAELDRASASSTEDGSRRSRAEAEARDRRRRSSSPRRARRRRSPRSPATSTRS